MIEAASIHEVEDGTGVLLEGDLGESMYLHQDGELTIEKQSEGGNRSKSPDSIAGEIFFGEMVSVDFLPRSATVRVNSDTCLFESPLENTQGFL